MEWIRTHSTYIAEFLRQCMYLGITFHLLNWNPDQQIQSMQAVSALLTLFTIKQTVASNKVDAIVDKAIDRVATFNTGTGSGVTQIQGTGDGKN